jgi:hypothetical protein
MSTNTYFNIQGYENDFGTSQPNDDNDFRYAYETPVRDPYSFYGLMESGLQATFSSSLTFQQPPCYERMQDFRSFENPAQNNFMIDEIPFTDPTPLSEQLVGSESLEIFLQMSINSSLPE